MRKVIKGRLYDTALAQLVASQQGNLSEFFQDVEALYRTAAGKWFLHGRSSAGGRYGREGGRVLCSGEDIVPLTAQAAVEWVESQRLSDEEATTIAALLDVPPA